MPSAPEMMLHKGYTFCEHRLSFAIPVGVAHQDITMFAGDKPGVYHRTVCEKTHIFFGCLLYQSTSTVSQAVSERTAHYELHPGDLD
jgi:hypothetical protein